MADNRHYTSLPEIVFLSMELLEEDRYTALEADKGLWDRVFTIAPLVIIGTREKDGYDLAPKHMVTPMGFGPYFGFVCTPRHGTYHNIKATGVFTVSFPRPEQLITTSLSATPRMGTVSKSRSIVEQLALVKASRLDAPMIRDAYLYLECELYKIIDGFGQYSLITGKIVAAHVHNSYLRISDGDEQEQLRHNPLLAYIANGRFATVTDTFNFPFPKDFKR